MKKYYQVCIDGIDKAGKDSLWYMLDYMCCHWLSINVRGLQSNLAYDIIYNRDRNYDLSCYKNVVTIYLTVDKEDWKVRCISTKEKDVKEDDYFSHCSAFEKAKNKMEESGLIVYEYNTTQMTPYLIAKDILNKLDKLNDDGSSEPAFTFINWHTDAVSNEELAPYSKTLDDYAAEGVSDLDNYSYMD